MNQLQSKKWWDAALIRAVKTVCKLIGWTGITSN